MGSSQAQSVRDRLLNRTRKTGEDHQIILTRFALERLLYRLAQLPSADEFALKRASSVWSGAIAIDLFWAGVGFSVHLEIKIHSLEASPEWVFIFG